MLPALEPLLIQPIAQCYTAELYWLFIVITTDKRQVDMQPFVITIIGISSLTTSKMILFYIGISKS
jgi:hypothetical protein